MAGPNRPTNVRVDADGVKTETSGVRPGVWLLVLAMVLAGALVMFIRPAQHSSPEEVAAVPVSKAASTLADTRKSAPPAVNPPAQVRPVAPVAAPPAPVRLVPKPESERIPPPAPPIEAAPAPASDAAPPNAEPPASGESAEDQPTGIALFPPPGTKPILRGIIVPEGIELPEGYVRHYQTTDEGQQLPAVLMFHPDYQLVDEHGQPITMPKDRLVPPEMVPQGIPVRILEPPERHLKPDVPDPNAQDPEP